MPVAQEWSDNGKRAANDQAFFAGCVVTKLESMEKAMDDLQAATVLCKAERVRAEGEAFLRLASTEKDLARIMGRQDAETGAHEPVSRWPPWLSFGNAIKVGLICGAMIAGAVGGCEGAKIALRAPAVEEQPRDAR
jgi:hypothetical protein